MVGRWLLYVLGNQKVCVTRFIAAVSQVRLRSWAGPVGGGRQGRGACEQPERRPHGETSERTPGFLRTCLPSVQFLQPWEFSTSKHFRSIKTKEDDKYKAQ